MLFTTSEVGGIISIFELVSLRLKKFSDLCGQLIGRRGRIEPKTILLFYHIPSLRDELSERFVCSDGQYLLKMSTHTDTQKLTILPKWQKSLFGKFGRRLSRLSRIGMQVEALRTRSSTYLILLTPVQIHICHRRQV